MLSALAAGYDMDKDSVHIFRRKNKYHVVRFSEPEVDLITTDSDKALDLFLDLTQPKAV